MGSDRSIWARAGRPAPMAQTMTRPATRAARPGPHCRYQIIIRAVRVHLTAIVLVLGWAATAALIDDGIARTVALAPGTAIRIDATIANVTIVGSARSDVSVEIVRRAPSPADLARYPATIVTRADGLHVEVVQADDGRDANSEEQSAVAAPAGAVLRNPRLEGRVTLTNLSSACDADLRRGPIWRPGSPGASASRRGSAARRARLDAHPGGMMRLRVFNGPVRVRFARTPATAAFSHSRSTADHVGDSADQKDKFGPRFGETTLGDGDPVMSLDIVKGDVTISVGRR